MTHRACGLRVAERLLGMAAGLLFAGLLATAVIGAAHSGGPEDVESRLILLYPDIFNDEEWPNCPPPNAHAATNGSNGSTAAGTSPSDPRQAAYSPRDSTIADGRARCRSARRFAHQPAYRGVER